MNWIGRVFEATYGLDTGNQLEVISEPRVISRRGETAVVVRDSYKSEYEVETDKLEHSIYYTER